MGVIETCLLLRACGVVLALLLLAGDVERNPGPTGKEGNMSRLIWTPLKSVPPGTNFSEIFGPTLKNLFPL